MKQRFDAMHHHTETFMPLAELGNNYPAYRPTYDFAGEFIDSAHRKLAHDVDPTAALVQIKTRRWFGSIIPGWLRREDALKLYELAYFSPGDILELGSYHGLSTSILATANRQAPQRKTIYSVDLDPECGEATQRTLQAQRLDGNVTTITAEASAAVRQFAAEKNFAFVFVDHSHAYQPVLDVCLALDTVIASGGFCLFHDFNDPRNKSADEHEYGVYQAVTQGLPESRFEFWGIYGCAALYRAL